MKTIFTAVVALLRPHLFGAEYLHVRNDRDTSITYAIHGIVGVGQVSLGPKESLSLRFPSSQQKVELVTSSGASSGTGKVFIVEVNPSPEVGSITLGDFGSYPILHRVIAVSGTEAVVRIEEKK